MKGGEKKKKGVHGILAVTKSLSNRGKSFFPLGLGRDGQSYGPLEPKKGRIWGEIA